MSASDSNLLVDEYVLSFDELISLQTGVIGSFKKWVRLLIVAGLIVITVAVVVFLYTRFQVLAPSIVAIGGVFLTGSAAFPGREISFRRSEIIKYTHLKRRFERFPDLSEEERRRTCNLADDMIKRS
jgi:hypothetical protein